MVMQAMALISFVASLSALWRVVSLRTTRILPPTKDHQKNQLTDHQLKLLGFKSKSKPAPHTKPPKLRVTPSCSAFDVLIPIRKWGSNNTNTSTPSRPSLTWSDWSLGSRIRVEVSPLSATATPWYGASPTASWSTASPSPSKYDASLMTPWLKRSSEGAKRIVTEVKLEEFLADSDVKFIESVATPSPAVCGFGVASPGSVSTTTTNGTARSTPLRPVRMSPGSHNKYNTPAKKGDVELPLPMTMEQTVDVFVRLGIYSHIEEWRDRLRQWLCKLQRRSVFLLLSNRLVVSRRILLLITIELCLLSDFYMDQLVLQNLWHEYKEHNQFGKWMHHCTIAREENFERQQQHSFI